MSKKCSKLICVLLCSVMLCSILPAVQFTSSAKTVDRITYVGEFDGNKAYTVSQVEVEEEPEVSYNVKEAKAKFEAAKARSQKVTRSNGVATAALGTNDWGDITFETFADLKQLASATYDEWTSAYYAGSAEIFTISENITLPENLELFFHDDSVTVPKGVTVTSYAFCYFDDLTINGTVVSNASLGVSGSLTVNGALNCAGSITLEESATLTGLDKISLTGYYSRIFKNDYVSSEAEVYEALNVAANDKNGFSYDVYVDTAVTLKSNFTIPANTELVPWEAMTINGTCTVNGSIYTWESPITVNGKLVNNGQIDLDGTTLTISTGASYSGTGMLICYGNKPEDAIKGMSLEDFDTENWGGDTYHLIYVGNKVRLDAPTNLFVETNGYLGWTNGQNIEDRVGFNLYCNGELVYTWEEWGTGAGEAYYTDTFRTGDWESGTYYFEVWSIAESGSNYRNSETVKSATWTYTRPSTKLGTCTDVKLTGTVASWKAPSNTTNMDCYRVYVYYYESENAQYLVSGGWIQVKNETSVDIEEFFHLFGEGYYEVEVQALTADINKTQNGDVSAPSNRVHLTMDGPERLAGNDRFETSLMVAEKLKEVLGVQKFDAIVVACGTDFADALAGSYLCTVKNAPIILSWGKGGSNAKLDDENISYIKENLKPGGTVYLLGGEKAVPKLYENALSQFNVKRLGGANRFETNLMILQEAGVKAGQEILVCTATDFADSLSASAAGLPILLVLKNDLYGTQPDFLKSLGGKNTFCIVGGENAVSKKLENTISTYGATTRLAGNDRLQTSVLVAERYCKSASSAVIAYGWNYPDGLCGGALAYAMKAPLLLTHSTPKFYAIAKEYVAKSGIESGIVLGGEKLITPAAANAILSK